MRQKKQKPFWEMTTAELREATQEFETGDGGPAIKPPRKALAEQRHARRKKRGRPVIGKGAKRVSVSMERKRLKDVDLQARKRGWSRSEFIAYAVERELAAVG
jgi:hypothetical protein